ncbi:nucleoid-associated protein [Cyclobacteriaceae bacterium]|nr:nucleoid-associated protein [Cyclobacteriaceae bacterium]MDB4315479.1 nucleoid-associated protein [Cyclobacteriaceae bacterium]MDB4742109.1 nucleoid-associated protein [Cyclobacteriaceae bacterium]
MIEINGALAHKFISHYHAPECIMASTYVDIEASMSHEVAQILLPRIIASQGEFIFDHEVNVELNPVRKLLLDYFGGISNFHEITVGVMKVLAASEKNISEGEVYMTAFDQIIYDQKPCQAVGIFKIDGKQSFIESSLMDDQLALTLTKGIGIKDLNKGALIILDSDKNEMILKVFQNHADIKYWRHQFLMIRPLENEFYQTKNILNLCKDFALNGLDEMAKVDQVDLLNKTVDYFSEKQSFDQSEFEEEVLASTEIKAAFNSYKDDFEEKHQIEAMSEQFEISKPAFKAAKKYIKSVIKLDRNFHVYVHCQRQEIERGYDEVRGKNYYKLYFDQES